MSIQFRNHRSERQHLSTDCWKSTQPTTRSDRVDRVVQVIKVIGIKHKHETKTNFMRSILTIMLTIPGEKPDPLRVIEFPPWVSQPSVPQPETP